MQALRSVGLLVALVMVLVTGAPSNAVVKRPVRHHHHCPHHRVLVHRGPATHHRHLHAHPRCGFAHRGAVHRTPAPKPRPGAAVPSPAGTVQPAGPVGAWTLRFRDEFSGSGLDRTKWNPMEGGEMNNVRTRAANVSVSGGLLHLRLASSTSGAEVCSGGDCGRGYALPVGGVAEARVYFPGAAGEDYWNWPAWWASGPSWPAAGEHDIAEGLGGDATVNYHSPSGSHNHGTVGGTWRNAFHVYTLHRKATSADVYWDGVKVKSYPTDDNHAGQSLILNVGASGSRTAHTGKAGEMKVDYVRAWTP